VITLLTGSNEFALKQALAALRGDFVRQFGAHAVEQVAGETLDANRLADLFQGSSLFASMRLVIVHDMAANKQAWEALANYAEADNPSTTVVIIEPSPDKRTKTYKALTKFATVKEFGELSEHDLATWLQKSAQEMGNSLSGEAAAYLVGRVGTNQWLLWQELQKLSNATETITKAHIDNLTEPNPQASVFELLDAVLGHKTATVKELLGPIAATEDPYKFLGLLIAQVHALAIVKYADGRSADTIAKEAGLHPFVVRKTQGLARTVSQAMLMHIVEAVALCDAQLKSTGAEPWLLIEQCLHKLIALQ
jgi:DNA polymerase-3 subunit delta